MSSPAKRRTDKPRGNQARRTRLEEFYNRLYHFYGPQGWWPTTALSSDRPQYWPFRHPEILTDEEKFEICLGAILTQNTNWGNVVKVLSLLKSKKKLHLKSLMKMPLIRLQYFLRSSGYFRQKAVRVRNFLRIVGTKSGGRFSRFLSGALPKLRAELLAITGIGPETADSMLLYAGGYPSFVVDAYTRRLGARWGILKGTEPYEEIQKIFTDQLPASVPVYGEFHALIVELAKRNCRKDPACDGCPVKDLCEWGKKEKLKNGR